MSAQPPPHQPTRQQLDELDALLQKMLALPLSPFEESLPPVPAPPPLPPVVRPAVVPVAVEAAESAGWSGLIRTPAVAATARPASVAGTAPPVPPFGPALADPSSLPGGSSVFAAWGVTEMPPEARRAVPPVTGGDPAVPELGRPVGPFVTVNAPSPFPPDHHHAPADAGRSGPLPGRVPLRPAEPVVESAGSFRYAGLEAVEMPEPEHRPMPDAYSVADAPVAYPAPRPAPLPAVALAESADAADEADPAPVPLLLMPLDLVDRAFFGVLGWFGPPGRWLGSPAGRNLIGAAGLLCLAGAAAWGVVDWLGWTW